MRHRSWPWWFVTLAIVACVLASRVGPLELYGAPQKAIDAGAAIANGRIAAFGEFPFMVRIHTQNNYSGSGFLITPNHVLTAAHMVEWSVQNRRPVDLYIGGIRFDGSDGERRVSNAIYAGPGSGPDWIAGNDYALVSFSESSKKMPVKVDGYNATVAFWPGMQVTVVGFGRLANGNYPAYLQKGLTKIKTLDLNKVIVTAPTTGSLSYAQRGDSGSPLLVKSPAGQWVAIGIFSFLVGKLPPMDIGSYCPTRQALVKLATHGPDLVYNDSDAANVDGRVRKYAFTGRRLEGGRWKCPTSHEWDAGVLDRPVLDSWYKGKQCSPSVYAASLMNMFHNAKGQAVNPVHHRTA